MCKGSSAPAVVAPFCCPAAAASSAAAASFCSFCAWAVVAAAATPSKSPSIRTTPVTMGMVGSIDRWAGRLIVCACLRLMGGLVSISLQSWVRSEYSIRESLIPVPQRHIRLCQLRIVTQRLGHVRMFEFNSEFWRPPHSSNPWMAPPAMPGAPNHRPRMSTIECMSGFVHS